MADRGKPIDPQRLKSMAAAVQKQVSRADHILKNMNRFAHSVDESVTDADLGQLRELTIALTDRFAAMQQVKVDFEQPPESPRITTAPFHLINLVCLCLDFCMPAVGDGRCLELSITTAEDRVLVHFNRLAGLSPEVLETFPSDAGNRLLEFLAADLTSASDGKKITLGLPVKLE